ncbi:MAG: hypothetical protein V1735_04565, partial [Nanoarchaeota archaeon]
TETNGTEENDPFLRCSAFDYPQCKMDNLSYNGGNTSWFSLDCYTANNYTVKGCYHASPKDCNSSWLNVSDKVTAAFNISCNQVIANESSGRTAIEEAFDNTGITSRWTNKQVYTRSSSAQNLGLWDKVARLANHFWTVNYVTLGESWQNATNLSPSLYQAEFAKMTYDQLKEQVEALIDTTKTG